MRNVIERAAAMGIQVTGAQADALDRYCALLTEANLTQNLTSVSEDRDELLDRHVLDSLTPLTIGWPEDARRFIDVGSGAGLPGIPLAILRPDAHAVLLDALEKRVKFLNTVIDALGLNAEAVHGRAEEAARDPAWRDSFDVAVARAVAPLPLLTEYLLPFVRPGGRMLALKGPLAEEELAEAAYAIGELGGGEAQLLRASIPERDWSHVVVRVDKRAPTLPRYPRRPGIPEKRPLLTRKKTGGN